jgi:hypothetical protein
MHKHRNPRLKIPKVPTPNKRDPTATLDEVRLRITELEALTHAAEEALHELPRLPDPEDRRSAARLYFFVTRSAQHATGLLDFVEGPVPN